METTSFSWKQFGIFLIIALALSSFFHFFYPNIADPDSFYHARHAEMYLEHPLDSGIPWMKFSAIAEEKSDLWYGFHLVLAPFVGLFGIDTGIRVAGVFLTTLFLVSIYLLGKRHSVPAPWLWPFVAFFILPNAMYFFVMVRPHMLSLVCALALASFLARGKLWQVTLLAGLLTFFHASLFWLPLFIVTAWTVSVYLTSRIQKFSFDWTNTVQKIAWAVLGTGVGLLVRPEPLGGVKLAWIQIVTLTKLNLANIPIISGTELVPLGVAVFTTALLMLIAWIGLLYVGGKKFFTDKKQTPELKVLFGTSTLLSLLFGVLSIFVAVRFFTLWIVFTVLAYALWAHASMWKKIHTQIVVGVLVVLLIPFALYRHNLNERYVATSPEKFELAARWLTEHSQPGETIFNTHWDQFGSLIHWNTRNTYIGGMHSIFQYAYNPSLYWNYYYLSEDIGGDVTCPTFPCAKENLVPTYDVLKNDFKVRYVFIEPARNPNIQKYLVSDKRFALSYSDKEAEIYEVR